MVEIYGTAVRLQVNLFQPDQFAYRPVWIDNIIIHSFQRLESDSKMTKMSSGSNYNKRKSIYFPGNTTGQKPKPSTVQSVLFDYSSIIRSTPSSGSITGFNNFSTNLSFHQFQIRWLSNQSIIGWKVFGESDSNDQTRTIFIIDG